MVFKRQTEEQNFLFSRSENVTQEDLIETPDGKTYDDIMKALYKLKDEALAKHKARLVSEAMLKHN